MADLTKYFPTESPIVTAIYAWHKQRGDAEPKRGYLGASIIGHSCERYLWYQFRQCCKPEFSGRLYRLFETGDLAEFRFVKELRRIGCEVHEVDQNGQQFEILEFGGHFSGHMDGAAIGIPGAEKTWHVLEFKTHNNKSFTKLKKDGVQKAFPKHSAQMQSYMHKTGMKRALYLASNKDTDELCAERLKYDGDFCKGLMDKAKRIITMNEPPAKLSERRDYYECKFCDARDICHGTSKSALPIPSTSCRQCCHATPVMAGRAAWTCSKHKRGLSPADQDAACEDHLILPGLLSFAKPVEYIEHAAGIDCIEFAKSDGELFRHGRLAGEFSTEELMKLPVGMLSSQSFAKQAKDVFGAKVTAVSPDDIVSRYPEEDSRILWKGSGTDMLEGFRDTFCVNPWEPIARVLDTEYQAAEFEFGGGDENFVVIKWLKTNTAEIRQGVM